MCSLQSYTTVSQVHINTHTHTCTHTTYTSTYIRTHTYTHTAQSLSTSQFGKWVMNSYYNFFLPMCLGFSASITPLHVSKRNILEIVYYFQSTKLLISFTCLQLNSIFSLLCLFFPIANFCFAGFQKLFFFHFFSIYLFFSNPFACFSGFSYISLLFLSWQKSNILDNSHFNLLLRLILTKQNLDLRSHWVWTLNKHKLHTKNNYVNSKTLVNINHCPVKSGIK